SKEMMNWYFENNQESFIVVWNDRNQIMHISDNIAYWFNLSVNELIGTDWTQYFSSVKAESVIDHFRKSEEKLEIPNLIYVENNGKKHFFHTVIDKMTIESEQYFIAKLKDATLEKELQAVIQESEKLVMAGQLSAGLVHEIRNPLTSLKGFLQLIQAGIQQKEQYFHVMISEIEKLEKITSELLHMAKPLQNGFKTEQVAELIQDVLFIMSTQSDLRNVYFTTDLEKNVFVECDASQIKQVLINIIKNGAEAMDKSGVIHIEMNKEIEYVAIHIHDEGKGISEDVVKEVGTPF